MGTLCSQSAPVVAIIGGTGLSTFEGVECVVEEHPATPFGPASASIQRVLNPAGDIYFLPRHGGDHTIAPHLINYRANIALLQYLNVSHVLAVNAVGGLGATMGPGALVVPDQIIDYTVGRDSSFFDGVVGPLDHIDFTEPYGPEGRRSLFHAAQQHGIACHDGAVYGCTQGPRLETAAEIRRCQRDGCDLVGMTGMPEAALAREAGMDYASLCLVVNWGAGLSAEPITLEDIRKVVSAGMVDIKQLLLTAAVDILQASR